MEIIRKVVTGAQPGVRERFMKTTMIIFRSILLAVILIGSNNRVHADTPAAQTGWLLRTATTIGVDEVAADPPLGSQVTVYKNGLERYMVSNYKEQEEFTMWGLVTVTNWVSDVLVIDAGEQFVFHMPGGTDEYLSWPYAYVGGWRLTAPEMVSGTVQIEWSPTIGSNIPGNPRPDYSALVWITEAGKPGQVEQDLGVVWETESVVWDSSAVADGTYDIVVSFSDSPYDGALGGPVAEVTKQVVVNNTIVETSVFNITRSVEEGGSPAAATLQISSPAATMFNGVSFSISDDAAWMSCSPNSGSIGHGGAQITVTFNTSSLAAGSYSGEILVSSVEAGNSPVIIPVSLIVERGLPNPIEGGRTILVDGEEWIVAPTDLVIGASSTGNTLIIRDGGRVVAASLVVHDGSSLQLLAGGELIVEGDFDAGQGGFDFAAGGLAVGGSVSGISSLPAGNRLEALEIEGDLTVYGVFSPSRAEMIPLVLGEDVLMAAAASAPGAIVTGSLALEPGGALEMEIGGYTVGTEFDHLTVTDAATLGGELSIVLTDGFIPLVGHSFELFNFAGGASGMFSAVNLLGPLGLTVDTSSLYSNGEISFELSESDLDADGIVDGWEFRYFKGDVWPTNNADGDSLNTLKEYIAGTDPKNASSYFRSEAADKVPEGFLVEWSPSVSNRIYSVLWTNELSGGFFPLETNIAFPRNSYTDTTHAAESAGFYLIDVRMRE